jgi:IS1 family transposase
LGVSFDKIDSIIKKIRKAEEPKKIHYEKLEVDKFWTYVKRKIDKIWLIYAYDPKGEVAQHTWGKRDLETAQKLRKNLEKLEVTYDKIGCDEWDSFLKIFEDKKLEVGKKYTTAIEGNNCRPRHRNRRFFRRTCNFSKSLKNHLKVFELVKNYVNFDFV